MDVRDYGERAKRRSAESRHCGRTPGANPPSESAANALSLQSSSIALTLRFILWLIRRSLMRSSGADRLGPHL